MSAACFPVENPTELSQKLKEAHETMNPELKKRFPDALYYLQKSPKLKNFRTVEDLPRTPADIAKLISDLRQNDAVLYLLKKAFDITPPIFQENILTGYSYNVFEDRPLPVSPFDLGELQNSDIGYQFPSMVTCNVDFKTKDIIHLFNTRSEYLDERLRSLSIGGNIPLKSFKGAIKQGHNIVDEIFAPNGHLTKPVTAIRELRTFELVLADRFRTTAEFKKAVSSLTPYNASDHGSVDQWKAFFNKYGTHVVKSVYGGGAIEVELNTTNAFNSEIGRNLMSFIQAEDISLGNSSLNKVQHSFRLMGGDKASQTSNLTKLQDAAADVLEKWKESLISSPTILKTEMRLLPLTTITHRLRRNFTAEIERAIQLLFNSSLTFNPPPPPSKLLPGGDRQSTPNVQTTQLIFSFTEKINESVRLDEKFHQAMLSMEEAKRRSDEHREMMYANELAVMQPHRKEDVWRRKEELFRKDMEIQRTIAESEYQANLMRVQVRTAHQQIKLMQSMITSITTGGGINHFNFK